MNKKFERRRVAYIISYPEWYGHNVNDMFFRLQKWIFVPVQDLSAEDRIEEYKKAFYFFVSGYGNKEEALNAYKQGCVLIGVRADVSLEIPIIECGQWDPVDVFITFLFIEWLGNIFPNLIFNKNAIGFSRAIFNFFRIILRPFLKIFYLLRAALITWKTQGFRYVFIKTRNYFHKVMHI
ncbi:MAG: hypothetical protein KGL67_00065 [Patescibacteria group bacterium]|nr:hypothetical protein [Patescibacteria group bacterium]